jgi:hypothetical protein
MYVELCPKVSTDMHIYVKYIHVFYVIDHYILSLYPYLLPVDKERYIDMFGFGYVNDSFRAII